MDKRHAAKNRFKQYKRSFFDNPTIPDIMDKVGLLQLPPEPQPQTQQAQETPLP